MKMKLSSKDIALLIEGMASSNRNVKLDLNNIGGVALIEYQVRRWLLWHRQCVKKGFVGHDGDINKLKMYLRLINNYKKVVVAEDLAKGF